MASSCSGKLKCTENAACDSRKLPCIAHLEKIWCGFVQCASVAEVDSLIDNVTSDMRSPALAALVPVAEILQRFWSQG